MPRKTINGKLYPIPAEERWKTLVLLMRDGSWVTTEWISEQTKWGRRRVRNLLKKGMKAGFIERSAPEEYFALFDTGYFGDSMLKRKRYYYRMNLGKMNLVVK